MPRDGGMRDHDVLEKRDVAMTANSVTSVSLDPPLILVCIAKTARFHEAIIEAKQWGVSVFDATSHELSSQFARPGRERNGQLEAIRYDRGPATGWCTDQQFRRAGRVRNICGVPSWRPRHHHRGCEDRISFGTRSASAAPPPWRVPLVAVIVPSSRWSVAGDTFGRRFKTCWVTSTTQVSAGIAF